MMWYHSEASRTEWKALPRRLIFQFVRSLVLLIFMSEMYFVERSQMCLAEIRDVKSKAVVAFWHRESGKILTPNTKL